MSVSFYYSGLASFSILSGGVVKVTSSTPFLNEWCIDDLSIRNALKQDAYSGSGIPEYQLSFFLINHDPLVFIYCSFQDHF